LKVIQNHRTR